MKLNVQVDADDTMEEIKAMADEFLVGFANKYLSYLYVFIAIIVITLVLTSCFGAYLAIWCHHLCGCRRCRCCLGSECGQEQETSEHKDENWRYSSANDDETFI